MKQLYHGVWAEIKCSNCGHPCEHITIGETTTAGYAFFQDEKGWHVHDPNRIQVEAYCWRCPSGTIARPIKMMKRGFAYCECGWRSDKESQ